MLGVELFERPPREMKPTEIGRFVLQFADQSLNVAGKFVEELDDRKCGGYGIVQVGVTYGVAHLISPCIVRMNTRHPRVLDLGAGADQPTCSCMELKEKTLDVVIGRFTGEDQHNWF